MKSKQEKSVVASLSANRPHFLSATVLLFALLLILSVSVSVASNQEVAISTVSEAEQLMAQAYDAVLDAERAGADVSGLLVKLNDAADLLSEATMAFEAGEFEEAIRFSELARDVGSEVVDEAEGLETEASYAGTNRMWLSVVASVLAVAIVVCAGFLGYRIFKRHYYERLLKSRPKVGQV